MEDLKSESIKIKLGDTETVYQVKEKDHGDLVVYDVLKNGYYLLTIAKDGSILFMNFNAPEPEKEIFKLSLLNQFIQKLPDIA